MSRSLLGRALNLVHQAASAPVPAPTDGELLRDYVAGPAPAVFDQIVRRHGPTVLGVCRRVLGHHQDAEDAFQATFIILARNAGSVRSEESLAGWLHGVAYRTAMRAKRDAARRRRNERLAPTVRSGPPDRELDWREVQAVLDEEVERLPAVFRDAFVLCVLRGLARADAARELGVTDGTVSSRLARARKLLQAALGRRGVTLTGVLTALALTGSARAAVPKALTRAATQLAAGGHETSGSILDLVEGVTRTMFTAKTGPAVALTLLLSLLGVGAGVYHLRANAGPLGDEKPVGQKPLTPTPPPTPGAPPGYDEGPPVVLAGRVLDPSGEPVNGAKVTVWTAGKTGPQVKTGADGRFRLTLKADGVNARTKLVASADGCAPDWADVESVAKGDDRTMRLAKDDVPIQGQILDLEGKPVANGTVRVLDLQKPTGSSDLGAWVDFMRRANAGVSKPTPLATFTSPPIPGVTPVALTGSPPVAALGLTATSTTTDKEGRFRLNGAGRERAVRVEVGGKGIEPTGLTLMTRTGRDEGLPGDIHHATFKHTVGPSKPVVGTVRDKTTGKPLAGVEVSAPSAHSSRATPDAEGRYRLDGHGKVKDYWVLAGGGRYFRLLRQGADTPGAEPVAIDFVLERGVVVRGRLTDKATGKPITGTVRYLAAEENPALKHTTFGTALDESMIEVVTEPDGTFEILTLPGAGWLCVRADAADRYVGAEVEGKVLNSSIFTLRGVPRGVSPALFNAVAGFDVPEKSETFSVGDLALERGRHVKGRVKDWVAGTVVIGAGPVLGRGVPLARIVEGGPSLMTPMESDEFTVRGLNPRTGRTLVLLHPEKKLGKVLKVAGDAPGPVDARLEPLGTLVGRVVDAAGKPRAGVRVWAQPLASPAAVKDLTWEFHMAFARVLRVGQTTDPEGRFRIEGLLPGLKYDVALVEGESALYLGEGLTIESGRAKDLGDRDPTKEKP